MPQSSWHKHLRLPLVYVWVPELRWGSSKNPRTEEIKANRPSHAENLRWKISDVISNWQIDQENGVGVPILLKLDPKIQNLGFLRSAFDFEVVVQEDDGFVIAVSGETWFEQLEQKIALFITWSRTGGNVAFVHDIWNEEERLLMVMGQELYERYINIWNSEEILLDISVSCEGKLREPSKWKNESDEEFEAKKQNYFIEYDYITRRREQEMEDFLAPYGIQWQDQVEDAGSIIFRVCLTGQCFRDILRHLKFIFEVSTPEDIIYLTSTQQIFETRIEWLLLSPPSNSASTIGIIDSWIQEWHVYLSPAINPSLSKSYLPSTLNTNDFVVPNGHGTRVAWSVLYSSNIPTSWSFELPYWLGNIRVLDRDCKLPETLLPPLLMQNIITDFHNSIKIFNHSINSCIPSRRWYMSAWASKIDEMSYENNIQIVQSAWNIWETFISNSLRAWDNYPDYLSKTNCRISNPWQSLQAITVWSLCIDEFTSGTLVSLWAKDDISPFSRVWLWIWDTTKPDLVEYGWSYVTDGAWGLIPRAEVAPELIKLSPPWALTARNEVWTSFTAPLVTHILGAIQNIFPNESTLLYRALLVNSAKWPQWAIDKVNYDRKNARDVLSQIGYGVPNLQNSLYSDDYRATFFNSVEMPITAWDGHFYKINIPRAILDSHSDIKVEITLSYKAKPKRTRIGKAGYLSNWIDWETSALWENIWSFKERIFKNEPNLGVWIPWTPLNWILGKDGKSSSKIWRSRWTLQKDWCIIRADQISSDGFHIAVIWHKWWDGLKEFPAYYSIVVSLEAVNRDVVVYNELKIANEVEIENDNQVEEQIEIDTDLV